MQPVVSKRFQLTTQDWDKFAHNSLKFFAPVGLAALLALVKQIPQDWTYGAVVLFAVNILIDLLSKWISQHTYSV